MVSLSPEYQQETFRPSTPFPGLVFRLACPADLPVLWENCFSEQARPRFQDHYRTLLKWQADGRCYLLVVEAGKEFFQRHPILPEDIPRPDPLNGGIIGSGHLTLLRHKSEIANLVIHPAFRNQGVGTAVIEILTRIATRQKLSRIEIGVEARNVAARRLYRRLGFGNERPLKMKTAEEIVLLSKSLCPHTGI